MKMFTEYSSMSYVLKDTIDLPISLRIRMIKFRCRNNKLPIELGSYSNIPRENRFCTKCNLDVLGDEFHVLFVSPFFTKKETCFWNLNI